MIYRRDSEGSDAELSVHRKSKHGLVTLVLVHSFLGIKLQRSIS